MGRRPPARTPSFLKILLKEHSNKMLIPPKFVELHRGTLARKCTLRPTGMQDSWPTGMQDSWSDPVTFHNVESQKDTTPTLPKAGQEKKANPKTSALEAPEDFMANSELPTFNRIIQPSYLRVGRYMLLKPEFAKMHLKDDTREVKIEVSGKTWTVGVLKYGNIYRLSRWWSHLAREQGLKVGDVCVFELINTKDYTLKLSVFSKKCVAENKTCKTKARSGKALIAAKKFSSLSKYPSCTRVMHSTYLQDGYLNVPRTFVKQMKVTERAKNVKLLCWGKEWDAVLRTYSMHSRLQHGWTTFVEENSLKIGDVCVLELIDKKDALIRVTISRLQI